MMTAEARAAQSERMKRMHAEGKMKKKFDPALQEALAKQPIIKGPLQSADIPTPPILEVDFEELPRILVHVNWDTLPMSKAQQFYSHLKSEFEKAGRILNARSNERTSGYTCFMCKKHFNGNPGMTDLSYIDPNTGLSPRVDICGELCVINYHKFRIDMRVAKNLQLAQEARGE